MGVHHCLNRGAVAAAMLTASFGALSMDLLQAYQAAQKNDATLMSVRAATVAERENLPQAFSQMLPNVYANFTRNENRLTAITPNFLGGEQTAQSTYPSDSRTLTLRQPLYRPQTLAQYRQTQAQVEDAEASLQAEEQNLAVRVSGAYFEAALSYDQLALVQAQKAVYTAQVDASRKLLMAGSGTRTDVDESQARLDISLAQEIEARQTVSYNLQQLQTLVLDPVDAVVRLDANKLDLHELQPSSMDEWTVRAESSSPQLQALRARVGVARQEVEKASAAHHPTLDMVAQWSNSKSESVNSVSTRYINNTLGVQLNIPLYAGGSVNAQVRQALARQERAEQQLEAGRRDLAMRVRKEFRTVTESIPRIRALEQALRSADQLVLSSRKSFQAGSRTVIDILNAEQQRMTVLRDLSQARYVYLNAKIRLLALVGAADREAVAAVNTMLAQ